MRKIKCNINFFETNLVSNPNPSHGLMNLYSYAFVIFVAFDNNAFKINDKIFFRCMIFDARRNSHLII